MSFSKDSFKKNLQALADSQQGSGEGQSSEGMQSNGEGEGAGGDGNQDGQGNPTVELTDEAVLGFLSKKTEREIKSFDDLVVEKVVEKEVPYASDFAKKYDEFYKETGGSVEEFSFVQKDIDSMENEKLVREILSVENPDMTPEDIDFIYTNEYTVDELGDDDISAKKKEIAIKRKASEAKAYLKDKQEKFKVSERKPLNEEEVLTAYQQKMLDNNKAFNDQWTESLSKVTEKFDGVDVAVNEDLNFKFSTDDKASKDVFDIVADTSFTKFADHFRNEDGSVDQKRLHTSIFKMVNHDKIVASAVEKAWEGGREAEIKRRVNPSDKDFGYNLKGDGAKLSEADKLRLRMHQQAARKTF